MKRILFVLALTLCSCTSMAWQVDKTTTIQDLDARFESEVANLWQCDEFFVHIMECPEYHVIWNRYWQARRELANR